MARMIAFVAALAVLCYVVFKLGCMSGFKDGMNAAIWMFHVGDLAFDEDGDLVAAGRLAEYIRRNVDE